MALHSQVGLLLYHKPKTKMKQRFRVQLIIHHKSFPLHLLVGSQSAIFVYPMKQIKSEEIGQKTPEKQAKLSIDRRITYRHVGSSRTRFE